MPKVKVSGEFGKTRYSMEDQVSGNVLITRENGDGKKEFYVPRDVVMRFALASAAPRLEALLLQLMKP